MEDQLTRICRTCKTIKELDCFTKDKSYRLGVKAVCKECVAKKWRDSHPLFITPETPEGMKFCKTCESFQFIGNFAYSRYGKDNLYSKCKSCTKHYYHCNSERIKKASSAWREANSEKYRTSAKKRYELNFERFSEEHRVWRENNKPARQEYFREYHQKNKTNPLYKIRKVARGLVNRACKHARFNKGNSSTCEIIGLSFEEFKTYIESTWESWMSWENYGGGNTIKGTDLNLFWDIDHIIPLSSASTPEEVLSLSHYTNLTSLCSATNRFIKRNLNGT